MLELLSTFGSSQRVCAEPQRARELMRNVGGHFLSEETIEAVVASAQTTTGVKPTADQQEMLKYVAGMLRDVQRRANGVEARIRKSAEEHEATSSLVEFAGHRTAVILVGLLGALTDYESPDHLEKAQGMNLCERTTGQTLEQKRKGQAPVHISKRGPGRARKMLYWLAMRKLNPISTSYCPIATAWYRERLRRNGGNATQGLVALMRKLIKALWWVARGQEYDGSKLFDVARLQNLGHL